YFMRLAKESGCRIYEGINPRRMPEKDYILRARRAYGAGVQGLAFWDMDGRILFQAQWHIMRRLGHRELLDTMEAEPMNLRLVQLKTIDGVTTKTKGYHDSIFYH